MSEKKNDFGIKMQKIPQHKNGKINPKSKNYDPYLADRRKKEKARRKANRLNRGR